MPCATPARYGSRVSAGRAGTSRGLWRLVSTANLQDSPYRNSPAACGTRPALPGVDNCSPSLNVSDIAWMPARAFMATNDVR
jgi:hypothetical protein